MQIQQLNRNDPERVLVMVKNVDGSGSITTGMGACLAIQAGSYTQNDAVRATAGLGARFVGVAKQDIAINDFGLVTAYGLAVSVMLSQSVGSFTVTVGDQLRISAVAGQFTSVIIPEATSTQYYKYVVCTAMNQATISNPLSYGSGIVFAL